MNRKRLAALAAVLGLVLVTAGCGVMCPPCPVPGAVIQWVSNLTGLEIDTPTGSTHVALDVNQVGTGDIVSFKDGDTEVFDIADGGGADFKTNTVTIGEGKLADSVIVSADIKDGTVVNADIGASAAVAYSKLAAMTAAHILVGNGTNVATVVNPAGDVEIANDGATSIEAGVIVNADVNASAAISATKIADGSVTSAEFQYIGGLTSDAQTQIDSKEATVTEGSLTDSVILSADIKDDVIVNADINSSAAISATKIADGSVTSAEFQYIGGLTSDAQTQIDGKEATVTEGSLADSVILSTDIKDGEIANADISASADIAYSKMEDFLKLTEGAVQVVTYGSTLTCVASFQPITSTAVITNVIIADGSVAGQIVVISNENAADDITILESGSNLQAGGNVTLTGGAKDLLTLLWDGAEWIRAAFFDN